MTSFQSKISVQTCWEGGATDRLTPPIISHLTFINTSANGSLLQDKWSPLHHHHLLAAPQQLKLNQIFMSGVEHGTIILWKGNSYEMNRLIGGFDFTPPPTPAWQRFNQVSPLQRHASLFSFSCGNSQIDRRPSWYHLISCCKSTEEQPKQLITEVMLSADLLQWISYPLSCTCFLKLVSTWNSSMMTHSEEKPTYRGVQPLTARERKITSVCQQLSGNRGNRAHMWGFYRGLNVRL